jgi:hypothetical protein
MESVTLHFHGPWKDGVDDGRVERIILRRGVPMTFVSWLKGEKVTEITLSVQPDGIHVHSDQVKIQS